MAESTQHKLDRVRRPRVQITYDVETGGAMEKVELPFVVGVMADLSGQPKEALRPMKDRKFTPIDRDNFNEVLEKATPRLAMKVQNRLTDEDTKLAVELNFKHIDDFEPARVAEQVAPLKELMEMRLRLTQLLSKMEGNDKLDQLLTEVLSNTEKALALAKQLGVETPSAQAEGAALLDQILDRTKPLDAKEREKNKDYVGQFLRHIVQPGQVISKDVETNIKYWVAEIDK